MLRGIGTAGTGIYTTHQCPARVLSCRRCGAPIIKVTRRYDGSRWRFTLLEVLPDADGEFVLDENGDPTEEIEDKHSFHFMDAERYIVGWVKGDAGPLLLWGGEDE